MTEPTWIDLTAEKEPLRLFAIREAVSSAAAGAGRRFHAHVRADQVDQVFDLPGFYPASRYNSLNIRPVNEHEIGFCEFIRFFGPDLYIHPEPPAAGLDVKAMHEALIAVDRRNAARG